MGLLEFGLSIAALVLYLHANGSSANAKELNVALNKTVTIASSAQTDPQASVDGETVCAEEDGRTTLQWGSTIQPWWQVDLGKITDIHKIVVHGQLKNFSLYLSNENITEDNMGSEYPARNHTPTMVYFEMVTQARYCRIKPLFRYNQIDLCEVQLFACTLGSYGNHCQNECYCKDGVPCNHVTGTCPQELCEPGWQDPACNRRCAFPQFGANCSEICHCREEDVCDHVDGRCFYGTCKAGWQGTSCSQECVSPQFGPDCSEQCHCVGNGTCDVVNGACDTDACMPGWRGDSCSTECESPWFGINCSGQCHCANNTTCDPVYGSCNAGLCKPGWQGTSCDQECVNPNFGDNCESQCHCHGIDGCDFVDGNCHSERCDPGWFGTSCSQECEWPTFGQNCSKRCHCLDSSCDHVDGKCNGTVCQKGWTGPSCSLEQIEDTSWIDFLQKPEVIGGSVGIVLIMLVFIVGYLIYRRRNSGELNTSKAYDKFSNVYGVAFDKPAGTGMVHFNNAYDDVDSGPGDNGDYYSFDFNMRGVKIYQLWDFIRDRTKDDAAFFTVEFMKLPAGLQYSCVVALNEANKGKNRYKDMYAYDHTRVPLTVEVHGQSDYINACYIDGYDKNKKFIACQGPTLSMVEDFWRMVWQEQTDKIVMLTNTVEKRVQKCLQYWPEKGEECCYGNLTIKLIHTDIFSDYLIRTLEVRRAGTRRPRAVRQYHFKAWPDKDVPNNAWCIVDFWRTVDTNTPAGMGPIVVHCSAGIGRSGTFIALDNLVHQAKAEGIVRPFQIVEALRRQRVNMVQTKKQYVYLYEALAEALMMGTQPVWTRQFESLYRYMMQKEKGYTKRRLEEQYNLIEASLQNLPNPLTMDVSDYGNMESFISESSAYQPQQQKKATQLTPHLGAYFLSNFENKNTFLVTRSPSDMDLGEFWSLIDEQHVMIVIMLTSQTEPCYKASANLGGRSRRTIGRFAVNLIQEKINKAFTLRSFYCRDLSHEEEVYLPTLKQFDFTAWKAGYETPSDPQAVLDLMDAVQRWQPYLSEAKPILIHSGSGYERCGLIAVLLNELQRIKRQSGHVNLLETVKTMKYRNRNIIASHEQFRFCYDVIATYIRQTENHPNS